MSDEPDQRLSRLLERHASRHVAGERLRASVRAAVALAEAGRADRRAGDPRMRIGRWLRARIAGWRSPLAGFGFGTLLALIVVPAVEVRLAASSADSRMVADHVAALGSGPLVEVESADRHTVKPWYQGRLDYAPPVPDLGAFGFPLRGGRVTTLDGRPTAALVYARSRHLIDVFVRPAADWPPTVSPRSLRGFNIVCWRASAMAACAVSDLERKELDQLARLWAAAVAE